MIGFRYIPASLFGAVLLWAPLPAQAQQKPTPGWIADSRTGCRAWNPNPLPKETIQWSGPCVNGVAHGLGVLKWFLDGKPNGSNGGVYRNGRLGDGRAVLIFANGNRYEGQLRNSKFHGSGVFAWADGGRYEGDFKEGGRTGRGVLTWPSGNRYEGDFKDGKRHGHGVMTWTNGRRYDGAWRDGKEHGHGVEIWPNRGRYEGGYMGGLPNGFGTLSMGENIYSGYWTNGCFRQGSKRASIGPNGDVKEDCGN